MAEKRWLSESSRRALAVLAWLGALGWAAGLRLDPPRAWADLLLVNFTLIGLGLIGAAFLAILKLSGARWGEPLRSVPQAMIAYLPFGAAAAVLALLGVRSLYPWASAGGLDPALADRAAFFNLKAFALRTLAYAAAWCFTARPLAAQEGERSQRPAAFFLVVFAATFTLASIDWVMSLEPRWYSTIYPWYLFAGAFVQGLAVLTLLVLSLKRRGFLSDVGTAQLRDLGQLLFAFSVFWAYLWFSQFLLIWYSNIPEETAYYVARLSGGWGGLFWLNPLINFVAPFFLLLKAEAKSDERTLSRVCALIVAGHVLDLYLQILPVVLPAGPVFGGLELAALLAGASAFLLSFDTAWSR